MKVYGIWYADYSNSYVDGRVYSSRDDAVAVCRTSGGSLQEFDLDPPLAGDEVPMRALRPGEKVFGVRMGPDGNGSDVSEEESVSKPPDGLWVRVGSTGAPEWLNGQCWAIDKKHAVKIINERRARWIAEGRRVGKTDTYGWGQALGL